MKITFLNQPKLSPHAVDQKFNEKRVNLIPEIENYIADNLLFKDESVNVSFFHEGVSSLVSLLETLKERYVLKVGLREGSHNREALFLKTWESIGVSVPHILEDGLINKHSYILMQYIDAKPLTFFPREKLINEKVFYQMGKILSHMHTIVATGYGRPNDNGNGEFEKFETWLYEDQHNKNQFSYVEENNLLPEENYGSVKSACEILIKHSMTSKSTYCHDDFGPYNIFYTNPLTVLDPVTMCNLPYLDFSKSIVQILANNFIEPEIITQLIKGYFEGKEKLFDKRILQAAVLLTAHKKFPYWNKTKNIQGMENIKKYLIENKIF